MADPNRLQIIAEFVDKVSQPVRRLERTFRDFDKTNRTLPQGFQNFQRRVLDTEKSLAGYGKRSESIRREFRSMQEVVSRVSPAIGRLTSEFGGLSIGSGTAIGAIAAVGTALVVAGKSAAEFSEQMKALRFGSSESGLGLSQLKQMQLALEKFNISQEATSAGVSSFRSAMLDAQKNTGAFVDSLKDLGTGGIQLAQPLIAMAKAGRSTSDEMEKLFDILDRIKKEHPGAEGEQLAQKFVTHFGLPKEFGRVGGKEYRDAAGDVKRLGFDPARLAEAARNAEKLNEILFKGRLTIDAWGTSLEANMIEKLVEAVRLAEKLKGLLPDFGNPLGWYRDRMLKMHPELAPPATFGERFGVWPGAAGAAPGPGGGRGGSGLGFGSGGPGGTPQGSPSGPGSAGGPPITVPEGTGAGGTGINRDRWLNELNANPALKDSLYRHSLGENTDPLANQAVMEEAANRASIRTQIKGGGGFGSHGNLSYFQGYYGGRISESQRAMLDANFDKVFRGGSDISGGAIDNSSQWLSSKNERTGRFRTTANFGGDRITGHPGVESFEIPGTGESMTGERAAWPGWRQQQLEEARARSNPMARLNLNAALSGGQTEISGGADLNVSVRAPAGTGVRASQRGIFRTLNMKRHMQMPETTSGPAQLGRDDIPL